MITLVSLEFRTTFSIYGSRLCMSVAHNTVAEEMQHYNVNANAFELCQIVPNSAKLRYVYCVGGPSPTLGYLL